MRLPTCAVMLLFLGLGHAAAQTTPAVQQVVVGQNVNMVGGPASYDPVRDPSLVGDPFLQRQNEPSLALSSRNPCHLLAGANDYRAVDLEEAFALETADAWLGVFKSFDCGQTWTSTLLPGHPADDSAAGRASPLKDEFGAPLQAGADATVRAGTSGMLYYSGIAFNRTATNDVGRVFVARFIDRNNRDGGDSIKYIETVSIDRGTSGQFLDKPWIATDLPRAGSSTCTVDGQTFPAGNVYIAYASFLGDGTNQHTKILFSRSADCGATWSIPTKLSETSARNQGTAIAVDPGTGHIYIGWREFTRPDDPSSVDAVMFVRSIDGGKTWTRAARITPPHPVTGQPYTLVPFDQAPSPTTFRTLMFPTMAIVPAEADGRAKGKPGRVYVAFSARGFAPLRASQQDGDARVVITSTIDGNTWTYPKPADGYPGAGHQIIPALAFAGGKLALAYYDLRRDVTEKYDDLIVEYGQENFRACADEAAALGSGGYAYFMTCVFTRRTTDRRHTLDLRASIADSTCLSAGTCAFTTYSVSGAFQVSSAQVSQYIRGSWQPGQNVQLQHNRPNLQLFRRGTYPFIGDYIDLQGATFLSDGKGGYVWNTGFTPARPAPVFHVAWGDNRDVQRPRDGDWQNYTPVSVGPNGLVCQAGQGGVRNQNVYTAKLQPGLVVSAPLNDKKIFALQRTFVIIARNTTSIKRRYRLTATPPASLVASFDQFQGFGSGSPLTAIEADIPAQSSISRTLFVAVAGQSATEVEAVVPVRVEEIALCAPGDLCGPPATDTVFLNPDFDSPDFDSPDFDSREFHTPDFDSPDFDSPDFDSPDFDSTVITTSIRTPDFDSPDFDSPDFDSPDFDSTGFNTPDFDSPDFDSPDFDSPDFDSGAFLNPDFDSPDFDSPDFDSATVSDLTWPLFNVGNTTSAYKANVYVNLPQDPDVRYQLVVRRIYPSPTAACAIAGKLTFSEQNQVPVNIVDPNVAASLTDRNFNDSSRTNATFFLAPGEHARITLRTYCKAGAPCPLAVAEQAKEAVALAVIAQAANCQVCTGSQCTGGDGVGGASECSVSDGLPRDIYDPVAPVVLAPVPAPSVNDADNNGFEPVTFTVSATDNLQVKSVTCSAAGLVLSPAATGGPYSFTGTFPVGLTAVQCTATDFAPTPNSATISFEVTVKDVTAPVVTVPTATTAEATGPGGATVKFGVSATDVIDGGLTVVCSTSGGPVNPSGSLFPLGSTLVSCSAADKGGNTATATFTVTVVDTTPPVLLVPANITARATGATGAQVTFVASATDLVDPAPVVTCVPASGSLFPLGTTVVQCTAKDASGNVPVPATFTVTVADSEAPSAMTATVTPSLLWPPDGRIANVFVSGEAFDGQSGVARLSWRVADEYGKHQPTGTVALAGNGAFSFQVPILVDRLGTDKNGRVYTIHITVFDAAGNALGMQKPPVVVVHDQGTK
jgi:hypothetical protein